MQENIYTATKNRIFKQSFLIWLFVATHIVANIFAVPTLMLNNQVWGIFFLNGFLSLITIPSVVLFLRYYKHSVGKKFIITYNSLKFIDDKTGMTIELKSSDIEKIYLVENKRMNRFPWLFHEHFYLIDNRENKILITSYFMDISEFWVDSLTKKVSSEKLIREEKIYPII